MNPIVTAKLQERISQLYGSPSHVCLALAEKIAPAFAISSDGQLTPVDDLAALSSARKHAGGLLRIVASETAQRLHPHDPAQASLIALRGQGLSIDVLDQHDPAIDGDNDGEFE